MLNFDFSRLSPQEPIDQTAAASYTLAMQRLVAAQRLGSEAPLGRQDKGIIDFRQDPGKPVILIGDLHARYDNLLAILGHRDNLRRLEQGEIYMLTLGDEVHRKEVEFAREMRSSVEMLRLLSELKWDNPHNFYSLVGTHSFLHTGYSKWNVCQGELMEAYIRKNIGREYLTYYEEYVCRGALAAVGLGFVAVHAGPPYGVTSLSQIRDAPIADDPPVHPQNRVVHDLTCFRFGMNYFYQDVDRFLKICGQESGQLISGHQVRNGEWLDRFTPNHFALSAAGDEIGYIEIVDGAVQRHEVPGELRGPAILPLPVSMKRHELTKELPCQLAAFEPLCVELAPAEVLTVELGKDDFVEFSLLNNGSTGLSLRHVRKVGGLKRWQNGPECKARGENLELEIGSDPEAFPLASSFGEHVSEKHLKVKFIAPACLVLTDFLSQYGSKVTAWRRS